jgi:chromosome partitioning protein
MQTIALVTQKGGSGKSTLAIGLALAATEDGQRVRLIDTDPQETLANWARRRRCPEPFVDAAASSGQLERKLWEFVGEGITLTIIDTASGDRTLTRTAMQAADLSVIPARPSPADLESAVHTL